jgi:hypothetical protein
MAKVARCDLTKRLVSYAGELGFQAEFTKKSHIKFTKPGRKPVFTSGTPSDPRALKNAESNLRKSDRGEL